MYKIGSLPLIHVVDDYHDLQHDVLDKMNIKYEEIGFDGACYIGLYWHGKKPSKKKIRELLLKEGYTFDDKGLEIYDPGIR